MFSLFIGRFQPFHEGHYKLIKTVLDEGKNVCIALRDTPLNKENPYTITERENFIDIFFSKEIDEGRVEIITIPDISEVCYGRKVGWSIRKIHLDKETENISATKIREKL